MLQYINVCVVQSVVYIKRSVEHCVEKDDYIRRCVEQDDYTRRYVWNRTTLHEDMCGTGRPYMKICVEQDDYT
jgi:hypothetical protein